MLISCPKCNAVYSVSENRVPESGKKFKCSECGNVWVVKPKDLRDIEPETPEVKPQIVRTATSYSYDDADVQEMFDRLSKDTKGLFTEQAPIDQKKGFWRKMQVIFSPIVLNSAIFLLIVLMSILIAYKNRFEIVNYIPRLETFYDTIGLDSIYAGRDIVFEDVNVKNTERNGKHYVEVSGKLFNRGKYKSKILPIKATLYNLQNEVEEEQVKVLTTNKLNSNFSALFHIMLNNNNPTPKKLMLKIVN